VVDSPELRKAIEAVQPERVAFELRFSQSKAVYDAVMDVRNTPAKWDKLSAEQQRIISIAIKDFRTSGVGLEPEKLKQYNAVIDRLAKLTTNFTNNVMDSTAVSAARQLPQPVGCKQTARQPAIICMPQ
jgi:oligopeptidase A